MNLNQFTIFAAIAKHRNVTKAAHELGVSQPSVSQQMKVLEMACGSKLYMRVGRGVVITAAGNNFLSGINPILQQLQNLKASFGMDRRWTESQSLAVGGTFTPSMFLLPWLVARFCKSHPGTMIDLRTRRADELERLVLRSRIEVAVSTNLPRLAGLTAEPFRREKLVFICSNRHPLARKREGSLSDIQDVRLVIHGQSKDHGTAESHLGELENQGLKLNIVMRCESPYSIEAAVRKNVGVGIVYEEVVRSSVQRGDLKILNVQRLKLEGETYILYRKDKPLSPLAQEFLHLLRQSRPKNVRLQ